MTSPVFVALDTPDLDHAIGLARAVQPYVGGLKLGLEFYSAQGPKGVRRLAEFGLPVFLDLKLHDIPNTVAGAVRALAPLGVAFLTIHVLGGAEMLRAAVEASAETPTPIRLLGVTVLTSLDEGDLAATGQAIPLATQVERLGALALANGLAGIICAAPDIGGVRSKLGEKPVLMVPGIRPAGSPSGDQKRTLTPSEAVAAGATYLVIGRPITGAPDPGEMAASIAASLEAP